MRPHSLLLATALACAPLTATSAQVATRYVGIQAGATTSDLAAGGLSSDARWGITAGLMVGAVTFDYSFVQLEPAWTQVGGGDLRLDYIDVPLLIGAVLPLGDRNTIARLYGGVGIGFKIGCDAGASTFGCGSANSTVWSLPVGLSFIRAFGGSRFVGVDARYAAPLSNSIDLGFVKTRSWQFRGMIAMPLGG